MVCANISVASSLGAWNAAARLRSWIVASSAKDARLPPTLLHADEVEQHLRPTRYAAGPSSFAVGIRANGRNPTGTEDGEFDKGDRRTKGRSHVSRGTDRVDCVGDVRIAAEVLR